MTPPLTDAPAAYLARFNAFDWLLLLVLFCSLIAGLVRGIIREVFGLVGTILALLLAAWNYAALAAHLAPWITSPLAAESAAFLLIAIGVLFACALLGRLLRGTAHTVGLGFLDRLAGGAFGLLRGALVSAAILLTASTFLPPQQLIANSILAPYFLAATREVCFVVPQDLQRRITDGIDHVRHIARNQTQ